MTLSLIENRLILNIFFLVPTMQTVFAPFSPSNLKELLYKNASSRYSRFANSSAYVVYCTYNVPLSRAKLQETANNEWKIIKSNSKDEIEAKIRENFSKQPIAIASTSSSFPLFAYPTKPLQQPPSSPPPIQSSPPPPPSSPPPPPKRKTPKILLTVSTLVGVTSKVIEMDSSVKANLTQFLVLYK